MELTAASPHSGSGFTRARAEHRKRSEGGSRLALNARSPHPPSWAKVAPASPAVFLLTFLLFFGFAGAAVACPACKDAIAENPGGAKLTQGWARSIYLLMWTPYLLFGGITFAIVRSARRAKK